MVILCAVPLTTICREFLLPEYLRRRQAGGTAHAADGKGDLIAGGEAARNDGGFLGLAGIVADDHFDRLAENAAGGVLDVDHHLDGFTNALALGGGIARHRPECTDLDWSFRCTATIRPPVTQIAAKQRS